MKKMDVATANHDQVCSLKLVNDVFFECRLASQTHRSYSRIFYPPNSAKLNKSFKILFTKDYGLLPYSKELLNIHYLLLLSTLPCPLFREFGEYLAPDRRAFATSVSRSGIFYIEWSINHKSSTRQEDARSYPRHQSQPVQS